MARPGRSPPSQGGRHRPPTGTEGIVLRYGAFYGPGTSLALGSEQFELVRKRKFPVVATAPASGPSSTSPTRPRRRCAIEHGSPRRDTTWWTTPAPVAEWLPVLAQALGAKKPMRMPRFVARLFAGEAE